MAEVQEHKSVMHGQEGGQLDAHLKGLATTTRWLKSIGIFTFLLTIANVGLLVYSLFTLENSVDSSEAAGMLTSNWLYSTVLFGWCIVSVVVFERMRKSGDTLFEEMSDELQWHIAYLGVAPKPEPSQADELLQERPPLDVRTTLRSYVRTTDLPIIPGKMGPALYVALNLTFTLILTIGLPSIFGSSEPVIFPEPATLSISYPSGSYDIGESERDSLKSFIEQIADFSRQDSTKTPLTISIQGHANTSRIIPTSIIYTGVSIDGYPISFTLKRR